MSWLNQLGGLVEQYVGGGADPGQAHAHYDQVAGAAPRDALADGITSAFRSDQTPPFAQMVGQLFGQASGEQRAGLLNTLVGAAGPALVSQVLSQHGLGALAGALGGGRTAVTPEEAGQVPVDAVQEVAARAEGQGGSVVDAIGRFAAEHPELVKGLGGAVVAAVLGGLVQRHRR